MKFITKENMCKLIEHHGYLDTKIIAMEECAELQKAISKNIRGEANRADILEEIADVSICISMLMLNEKITLEELEEMMEKKMERNIVRVYGKDK